MHACACVWYIAVKVQTMKPLGTDHPHFPREEKLNFFVVLFYPTIPSFLPRYNVRIFRSLVKGGQSQFLPWAISFPFLKFMFRRKKCFFLFLFLLQLSSLSWNLFLLSLTHLFPCRVLHLFFWCFFEPKTNRV
jgi:hypothetical protein